MKQDFGLQMIMTSAYCRKIVRGKKEEDSGQDLNVCTESMKLQYQGFMTPVCSQNNYLTHSAARLPRRAYRAEVLAISNALVSQSQHRCLIFLFSIQETWR